ncbi:MAG: hypothetical protein B7X06_04165, partial [Verrucomicrobia bacterium 21-51-4]
RSIVAFDIDPDVMPVCQENRAFNEIPDGAIEWVCADLEQGLRTRRADVVLANIQSNILIPHAKLLLSSVKKGGTLVLSGILKTEIEQVHACYASEANTLWGPQAWKANSNSLGDWADLQLIRC